MLHSPRISANKSKIRLRGALATLCTSGVHWISQMDTERPQWHVLPTHRICLLESASAKTNIDFDIVKHAPPSILKILTPDLHRVSQHGTAKGATSSFQNVPEYGVLIVYAKAVRSLYFFR